MKKTLSQISENFRTNMSISENFDEIFFHCFSLPCFFFETSKFDLASISKKIRICKKLGKPDYSLATLKECCQTVLIFFFFSESRKSIKVY